MLTVDGCLWVGVGGMCVVGVVGDGVADEALELVEGAVLVVGGVVHEGRLPGEAEARGLGGDGDGGLAAGGGGAAGG